MRELHEEHGIPWSEMAVLYRAHFQSLEIQMELTARGIPPTGTENYGGPVATAGGLLFIAATADEKFRAFEKHSGRLLWEYQLPAGGYATPSVYQIDGRQYVAIAAGGGTEKDLQPAASISGQVIQRGGGAWGITHATDSVLIDGELSACIRLSASRLQHAEILPEPGVKVRYARREGA